MTTALLLGSAVFASSGHKSALDKTTLEKYVRYLFVWGPQISVEVGDAKPSSELPGYMEVEVTGRSGQASQTDKFYISKDGQRVIRGAVFNVNENPFHEDLAKLNTKGAATLGTPGAPVKIVMFSDFECAYCREEAMEVRKNLTVTFPTQVELAYIDYPLEAIHPWAKMAAIGGKCALKTNPPVFWDYFDYMFAHQKDIKPDDPLLNAKTAILEFAKAKWQDPVPFMNCVDSLDEKWAVEREIAQGKSLGIQSTPTLYVNGRRINGRIPWPQLKQVIEYELDHARSEPTAQSDDKCCEMTLPTPIKK